MYDFSALSPLEQPSLIPFMLKLRGSDLWSRRRQIWTSATHGGSK
jgi:hypothetical protein